MIQSNTYPKLICIKYRSSFFFVTNIYIYIFLYKKKEKQFDDYYFLLIIHDLLLELYNVETQALFK